MIALPLTKLLHENMAVVVTFAFSQAPIRWLVDKQFVGDWKYLREFCFEIPASQAIRACLEIAVLIRLIDDQEKIAEYLRQTDTDGRREFGAVYDVDGKKGVLLLRDLTNKIIHARDLSWDLSDPETPKLVCISSHEQEKKFHWTKAEVDIVSLAAFCGELMS